MDNAQFLILCGLAGISIVLAAILLFKVKGIAYLLEQPVVKKMSPQLKLKPVKVDETDEEGRRNPARPAAPAPSANGVPMARSNNGRPPVDRGEQDRHGGGGRDFQGRGDRMPRHEREGGDRGGRGGDRDRFRDRDRGGRDRGDRPGGAGGDRGGRGRDVFTNDRENAAAPAAAAAPSGPVGEGAPAYTPRPAPAPRREENSEGAILAPRRPLPATVEQEIQGRDIQDQIPSGPVEGASNDPLYGQTDADITHGRRNQLKKKPRFNLDEEEAKPAPEETKA